MRKLLATVATLCGGAATPMGAAVADDACHGHTVVCDPGWCVVCYEVDGGGGRACEITDRAVLTLVLPGCVDAADGGVSPIDALTVLNELNTPDPMRIPDLRMPGVDQNVPVPSVNPPGSYAGR